MFRAFLTSAICRQAKPAATASASAGAAARRNVATIASSSASASSASSSRAAPTTGGSDAIPTTVMSVGGFSATTQLLAPKKPKAPKEPKPPKEPKAPKAKKAPKEKKPPAEKKPKGKKGKAAASEESAPAAPAANATSAQEAPAASAPVEKQSGGKKKSVAEPTPTPAPVPKKFQVIQTVPPSKSILLPPPEVKSRVEQAWRLRRPLHMSKYQQLPLSSVRFHKVTARRRAVNVKADKRDLLPIPRGVLVPEVRFRQKIPGPAVRVRSKQSRVRVFFRPCSHPNAAVDGAKKKRGRPTTGGKPRARASIGARFTSHASAASSAAPVSPMGAFMKANRAAAHAEATAIAQTKGLTGSQLNQFVFDQTNAIIGAKWRALSPAQKAVFGQQ